MRQIEAKAFSKSAVPKFEELENVLIILSKRSMLFKDQIMKELNIYARKACDKKIFNQRLTP